MSNENEKGNETQKTIETEVKTKKSGTRDGGKQFDPTKLKDDYRDLRKAAVDIVDTDVARDLGNCAAAAELFQAAAEAIPTPRFDADKGLRHRMDVEAQIASEVAGVVAAIRVRSKLGRDYIAEIQVKRDPLATGKAIVKKVKPGDFGVAADTLTRLGNLFEALEKAKEVESQLNEVFAQARTDFRITKQQFEAEMSRLRCSIRRYRVGLRGLSAA